MSKVLEQKQQLVTDIAEKLRNSKATIFVDYRGLNVAQTTELRKQLREANVEYKVYKNTMTRRAAEQAEIAGVEQELVGPTAVAFSEDDVIAPAKVLNNFAKENEALKIKIGVIEGNVTSADELKALAELPSRDGLLSMLLSVLQAPMRNMALATKAVADQKEEEGA
ncbi:50S ribosomal protein L10 [Bacillaceae bacterium SIJ1]|uniref:50S ribosomal protein L10 n=1 Tax=Litoribacterium kuwaitense TaxID=1398745 RepID=UPI0013EC7584|nr:50S ribosomal protein L10 [Litoribacterium kuwaitense]NGP45831.1 50S ribosomal protein L10 [Litoribacterium kuwaitense]